MAKVSLTKRDLRIAANAAAKWPKGFGGCWGLTRRSQENAWERISIQQVQKRLKENSAAETIY